MVFQSYALYPHMTVADNMGFAPEAAGVPKAERDAQGARPPPRSCSWNRYLDRKPRPALRRPAPARRHRPRHRAPAQGVPVRRAAVEPRRGVARADAHRARPAAPRTQRHDDLRHARPGRGDDAWPTASSCCRRASSSRWARPLELYNRPANTVRRRLHRLAQDEPHPGQGGGCRGVGHPDRPAQGRGPDAAAGLRRAARRLDRHAGPAAGGHRLPGRRTHRWRRVRRRASRRRDARLCRHRRRHAGDRQGRRRRIRVRVGETFASA